MAIMVDSVLPIGAILGEGPLWARGTLWFVDIKRQRVHRFDPATGAAKAWDAPDQVGWVLPVQGGGMIAGLKNGLHRFDPASGAFAPLADPEPHYPGNRLNDATTDRHGRIWFGSMDDDESELTGALYCCVGGMITHSGLPTVAITNGPAVSADARILYHTDTLGKVIWRVPIHDDSSLGTPERHIAIEDGAGHPDGSVIDAEGCLWVSLFGGWGVRRYDPAGALMRTIDFPVANVTKIAFGGPDLDIAYATTARKGLDAAALAAQPLAGNVFAFDPGVAGLAVHEAKI
ncbi:SMP-30/gluconolactonase/LRE family protein [Sphingomonas sp. MMSM20]|uniref:SMP-30/gluconolactonase/LRE family protein n=1 Tax=Sphingomonas lycopersici TaxID=2951807 RepID=UPI002238F5F0|nr:SMP-30/gluconolactonase/LRE family protein [Sphingomonas lycopersici]MCW6529117.1 SMP-30/gluconolactonase/LRE family protein [Sphingomonas lycopersici]